VHVYQGTADTLVTPAWADELHALTHRADVVRDLTS
jgi:hypothetical protein